MREPAWQGNMRDLGIEPTYIEVRRVSELNGLLNVYSTAVIKMRKMRKYWSCNNIQASAYQRCNLARCSA